MTFAPALVAGPRPTPQGAVAIQTFTPDLAPAVRAFNTRLARHGVRYRFPEEPVSRWLPQVPGRTLFQTYYVAVDPGGAVRGAYIIKRQDFEVGGERRQIGFYHLPLSEGLIDGRFAAVGVQLLADALKRQPDLFVLGIGSFEEPLARMLGSLGWRLQAVPFYFKVIRPFRVARRLRHLRRTAVARAALDTAAFTGVAWAGAATAQLRFQRRPPRGTSGVLVDDFGAWSDGIWRAAKARYALLGARDAETLALLYPPASPRFIRLQVRDGRHAIGWAVLLDTPMADHPYFGSVRVGSIVDCLAAPAAEQAVVSHALRTLVDRGVDLVVSNQSARCWGQALRSGGFLRGPSGFLFGASRKLAKRLAPADSGSSEFHLNRGDGDGPINL